jgi:RNA-directed DNA polymerase
MAKTRRTNGDSMEVIIVAINPIIRGWYEYYKHSQRTSLPTFDGYVRIARLRSILRQRRGGEGTRPRS